MKIAVEGCCHGELDKVYETVFQAEDAHSIKVDLLICCGDFQSVRNKQDLKCMAVPEKYMQLQSFHKYYSGEKVAPILTIFVGGNHEASNFLGELPYGGWVCPNIYYMGYAGVITVGGITIGGLSGIYKEKDYNKGRYERPPYDENSKRSCYHVRNIDVFRLKQVQTPIDIMISHDWPLGIYHHGDVGLLLRKKPFFAQEVQNNMLGSAPAWELLEKLKPAFWFSAHLHVKFSAVVKHGPSDDGSEIMTKFLALDKCLPRRNFLQVLDIQSDPDEAMKLQYLPEWLAILRSTNHLMRLKPSQSFLPDEKSYLRSDYRVTQEEMEDVEKRFPDGFTIPQNFEQTAAVHNEMVDGKLQMRHVVQPPPQTNPQTTTFSQRLQLTDPFAVFLGEQVASSVALYPHAPVEAAAGLNDSTSSQGDVSSDQAQDTGSFANETFVSFNMSQSDLAEDPGNEVLRETDSSADDGPPPYEVVRPFKRRSTLELPAPSSTEKQNVDVEIEKSMSSKGSACASASTNPAKEVEQVDKSDSPPPPKKKVFKRRNESAYSAKDDDSD